MNKYIFYSHAPIHLQYVGCDVKIIWEAEVWPWVNWSNETIGPLAQHFNIFNSAGIMAPIHEAENHLDTPEGRDLGKVPNKDLPEWWDNQMSWSNTDQSGMDQINHMSRSKASQNQKYITMPTRPRSTQHCYFVRPLFEGLFISGAPWWGSLCEWLARNYMSRHLENVFDISMSGKST